MANLVEEELFEEGVYQLEMTDPVQAGPNGIDNLQAKQLANRTKWLKAAISVITGTAFEAAKAIKLKTPRKINGTDFDGTADITITAAPTAHTHTDIVSAGSVMYFANSSAPVGFLKANGAAVSRTIYGNLFSAIGTIYGNGDGSTTFNLPDLRGEFIRGYDDGRGIDSGRVFGSSQSDEFKSHSHTAPTTQNSNAEARATYAWGYNYTSGQTSVTGGAETRPRNIALLACIKY